MKIQDVVTSMFHFEEQYPAPATPASGVVVIYSKTDGKMYMKDDVGTETCFATMLHGAAPPAASVGYRGQYYLVEGGAGVADILKVCVKKADDTYDWLTVGLT